MSTPETTPPRIPTAFPTAPDALLDGEIFYSLREAQIVIESWRRHFNTTRPHASLGYRPPAPEVFVPPFIHGQLRSPDLLRRPCYPWRQGRP